MYVILTLIVSMFIYSLIYYIFCDSKDFFYRTKNVLPTQNDTKDLIDDHISYWDILYFSIISQSTIGYGDIVPNSNKTKIIVIMQVFTNLTIIELSIDKWL